MIAVDTNILVYAHREEFSQHREAVTALRKLAAGPVSWGLPVFVLGEFVRVVTHPRILDPPTSESAAVTVVDTLLSSRSVQVLMPGESYWEIFKDAVVRGRARGNIIHDAQIAALCLEQGAMTILTEDRDFRLFEGITVRPLSKGV